MNILSHGILCIVVVAYPAHIRTLKVNGLAFEGDALNRCRNETREG